jgi:ethanolamine utilization protein EutJ
MLAMALDKMPIGPNEDPHRFLIAAAARFRSPAIGEADALSFGIDLGTATVVLTAVDTAGRPVYWDAVQCQAIRDGVVVNFAEAVASVRKLKADAERALGRTIFEAATAHPPGVPQADCRACRYVLEQAEINCRALVDEVSAAQALLGLKDGAIADVGGGSTGVGVFKGGRLIALSDRPGGGHYLDLILAGAQRIPIEEAERRKRMAPADYGAVLRPGLERIASSIKDQLGKVSVASIHLVGGAIRLPEAGAIIARVTGVPTQTYPHADLVTPFGIAVS